MSNASGTATFAIDLNTEAGPVQTSMTEQPSDTLPSEVDPVLALSNGQATVNIRLIRPSGDEANFDAAGAMLKAVFDGFPVVLG